MRHYAVTPGNPARMPPYEDNMTATAHEKHEADTYLAAAESRTNAQCNAFTSKASDVLSSRYVRGAAVLGIAAAGYALVRRKKTAKKTGISYRALERSDGTGDLVKTGSFLLPLLASFASAMSNAGVAAPAAPAAPAPVQERTTYPPKRSEDGKSDAKKVETATSAPPRPRFEHTSASWIGRQWQIISAAANAWMDDYAPSMGAALSYYTLFSLAPLLVLIIAIAGMVFGQDAAQGAIIAQLQGIMGEDGATAVQDLLQAAREPSTGIVASIVGGVLLLLGATAIFAELQTDLDRIWEVPEKAKPSGLWGWLRSRVLSFGLVLGLAFMLMISLVVSAALAATSEWLGGGAAESVLANVLNFIASFALFTVLFAMIYKLMPTAKISWHDVWMGAAVTALLFNVGKSLIGLYLAKSSVDSGFGAAGSFVILVAWFYYSAQIFLFGAEYTWVYANSKVKNGSADRH
ncbi:MULTISPECIES: YihY/virulence factor BrkB family protein [unclassified Massilia]|uniref:YihY/virulence factor BrkB family protein n=1 Tax=unclassified Massilia TaxID=2609279 RepID=UPI001E543C06|nr:MULTISPECIES: YihY/virulence factor BrkB family protein [unclassified Massilia]